MSEAAGTRSLEDILASIRQSLADENVDGLVKLSAAAAAAARAEVGEEAKLQSDLATAQALPDASEEDPLKDKLVGALADDGRAADDLADLVTEPGALPQAASAIEEAADDPAPVDAAALAKLWFLRPGAAEEAFAAEGPAPELRIDPFTDPGSEPAAVTSASALFALSARAIVGEGPAPHTPARLDSPASSADAAVGKPQAPRLDANQIEMINKLKASSAAAVESIASDEEIVDLRTPAWPPKPASPPAPTVAETNFDAIAPTAPAAIEPKSEPAPPATVAKTEPAPPVTKSEVPNAETAKVQLEDDPAVLPASLLTLPARSTPLFVGVNDRSRPIISAPPLASGTATKLLADSDDDEPLSAKQVSPAAIVAEQSPAVEPKVREPEPDLDDVLAPVVEAPGPVQPERPSRLTDALDQLADAEEAGVPSIHTIKTVAAPVSPVSEPEVDGDVAAPPLEQMIAAVLEPVMHRLLENNLGPMIEAMVRREVEKALEARRDT